MTPRDTAGATGGANAAATRTRRRRWLPVAILALGGAMLAWVALTYRPAPAVPPDRSHRQSAPPADCLVCHGPTGEFPQPENHPISRACFSCHRPG